ncbi:hypothetical protein N0V94_000380 [Neodidymelliopsis sp. IMI 364377]|nr:hypothetical protein N0V94_000380 [Neodidymelliopsis sp. IMI 364377]
MEWLPNGSGAKFSFLVTKLKPKPEPPVKPSSSPAPPQTPAPATPQTATAAPPHPTPSATPNTNPPNPSLPPTPMPSYVAPPRIEDFDERNDLHDVDFYQPVTVLVLTDEHDVKNALPRAIRPPSVVEKYMDDVFDTCKRAEETYLAFRLPREGADTDLTLRSGDATPSVSTPMAPVTMGFGTDRKKSTTGRSRRSLA